MASNQSLNICSTCNELNICTDMADLRVRFLLIFWWEREKHLEAYKKNPTSYGGYIYLWAIFREFLHVLGCSIQEALDKTKNVLMKNGLDNQPAYCDDCIPLRNAKVFSVLEEELAITRDQMQNRFHNVGWAHIYDIQKRIRIMNVDNLQDVRKRAEGRMEFPGCGGYIDVTPFYIKVEGLTFVTENGFVTSGITPPEEINQFLLSSSQNQEHRIIDESDYLFETSLAELSRQVENMDSYLSQSPEQASSEANSYRSEISLSEIDDQVPNENLLSPEKELQSSHCLSEGNINNLNNADHQKQPQPFIAASNMEIGKTKRKYNRSTTVSTVEVKKRTRPNQNLEEKDDDESGSQSASKRRKKRSDRFSYRHGQKTKHDTKSSQPNKMLIDQKNNGTLKTQPAVTKDTSLKKRTRAPRESAHTRKRKSRQTGKQERSNSQEKQQTKCPVCRSRFHSVRIYAKHMLIHTNESLPANQIKETSKKNCAQARNVPKKLIGDLQTQNTQISVYTGPGVTSEYQASTTADALIPKTYPISCELAGIIEKTVSLDKRQMENEILKLADPILQDKDLQLSDTEGGISLPEAPYSPPTIQHSGELLKDLPLNISNLDPLNQLDAPPVASFKTTKRSLTEIGSENNARRKNATRTSAATGNLESGRFSCSDSNKVTSPQTKSRSLKSNSNKSIEKHRSSKNRGHHVNHSRVARVTKRFPDTTSLPALPVEVASQQNVTNAVVTDLNGILGRLKKVWTLFR